MDMMIKMNAMGAKFQAKSRCALSTGSRGRGLFIGGPGPDPSDLKLITVPLESTIFVMEDVSSEEARQMMTTVYNRWEGLHGVRPPPCVMELLQGDWPKDWRIALGLLWATKHCKLWETYAQEWMPTCDDLPSLYLATAEELKELHNADVEQMAKGAQGMCDRAWAAVSGSGVLAELLGATRQDWIWAYAMVHTRCFGVKVKDDLQAVICAPMVDMVNHSFCPNSKYVCDFDAGVFMLQWDANAKEGSIPVTNAEVLVSYGDQLPNALLAVKFGFVDAANPNGQLPMDLLMPAFGKLQQAPLEAAIAHYMQCGGDERQLPGCISSLAKLTHARPSAPVDDNERAVVQYLINGIETKLAMQPMSIADDERQLQSFQVPCRVRTCIQFRLDTKLFWQACQHILQCWQLVTARPT